MLSCWWKRSLDVSKVMGLRSMIPSRSAVFNAAVNTACVCSPVQLLIVLSSLFNRLFFAVRRKLMKPRQKSKSTSSMAMLSRPVDRWYSSTLRRMNLRPFMVDSVRPFPSLAYFSRYARRGIEAFITLSRLAMP